MFLCAFLAVVQILTISSLPIDDEPSVVVRSFNSVPSYQEATWEVEQRDGWLPVGYTDPSSRQGSNQPRILSQVPRKPVQPDPPVIVRNYNGPGRTRNRPQVNTFELQEPSDTLPIRHKDYEIKEEDIISLPVGKFPEPTCQYSVLKGGLNGPEASSGQVNIGDRLFHRWRCFPISSAPNLYCISVTDCNVSAGNLVADLIDENGCSKEHQIVPHVAYSDIDKLDAWLEVNAFQLVGSSATLMNFHCQINILIEEDGRCPRPQCPPLNDQ